MDPIVKAAAWLLAGVGVVNAYGALRGGDGAASAAIAAVGLVAVIVLPRFIHARGEPEDGTPDA